MFRPLNIAYILIFAAGLNACNQVSEQPRENDPLPTGTTLAAPKPGHPQANTINAGKTIFPAGGMAVIKVLTTGLFHNDEVSKDAATQQWLGLYKGSQGFYLEPAAIKIQNVNDPVLDGNEGERSGWKISVPNTDSNYLLIEALPYLEAATIPHIPVSKKTIYPGDSLHFSYAGNAYKLFATGKKKKLQNEAAYNEVKHYQLFLTATINGKQITQLLAAQADFDDRMIEILLVADIDNDKIPDFIIDNSRHYNMRSPTLYLSRPAANNEVVTPVGWHTTVGG